VTDLSHAQKEAAAYSAAMSASARGDPQAFRLWREFARIHSERPQAVVEEMEKRMGLE
jgi:hypothetical protein